MPASRLLIDRSAVSDIAIGQGLQYTAQLGKSDIPSVEITI